MSKIKLLALTAILFFSCKKSIKEETLSIDKDHPVYNYIKQLGYPDSLIRDKGTEYIVDGDMVFSKSKIPNTVNPNGPKEEQFGTGNYVGYNVQPNITVRIDPSVTCLTQAVQDAIWMWNSQFSRIRFTITTSTNQHILITRLNTSSTTLYGESNFPIDGQPGEIVRINTALMNCWGYAGIIAHELGHAIGFRHTDWYPQEKQTLRDPFNNAYVEAVNILGTPTGEDANSIMNSGRADNFPTTLSNFDRVALQFLYPPASPAGTVPVFRYFTQATTQDHFYTTDLNELGNGSNNGYVYECIGFFAFPTQVSGSVPIYRYYVPSTGNHYYTANFNELGYGLNGWYYEGIRFYAYPSALNGSVPVYKYFNSRLGDHFFTKNQNEFFTGTGGWAYEGIAFYAH